MTGVKQPTTPTIQTPAVAFGPVEDRAELPAAGRLNDAPLEQLDAAGWPIATRAR